MKSKNRRTIKIIVGILVALVVCTGIFLYVAIFRGFYASSDIPAGEYTGSANGNLRDILLQSQLQISII